MSLLNIGMPELKCSCYASSMAWVNKTPTMPLTQQNPMRIKGLPLVQKSRLAGFFLLLLTACQPASTPYIPGQLSFEQAETAMARQLPDTAATLYRQAAEQGYWPAVPAYLAAQQAAQPQHSSQDLLAWVQQLADRPQTATVDPTAQQQLHKVQAELGGWQLLPPQLQHRWQAPYLQQWQSASACRLTLQPVLSTLASARNWLGLMQQWQQDAQLSSLPICFNPPQFIDSRDLACSEQAGMRIHCQASALVPLVLQGQATQLIVVAGQGYASYNNGWLQLPVTADLALFRHELSHLFGFLDEYPLSAAVAADECIPGRITPNLIFAKNDVAAYLKHWRLSAEDVALTAVATCQQLSRQAYRVVAVDSHLQHYELAMPALYLQLMQQQLQQPELLMPVQYYFAYLARQQQNWPQWQQLMQLAAKAGYPAAMAALAAQQHSDTVTIPVSSAPVVGQP
jgi:hypothetical protein